jgi:diguanylate cyclase (GGDEF)-like protein
MLTDRVAELSFLCDASAMLGTTLDPTSIAQAVLDAVPAATNGRARSWFLVLRDGNAIVCHGGAGVDSKAAEEFVDAHHGPIERSLRTGEIVSEPQSYVAVPMPGGPLEPGFGSIAVTDAGPDGLSAVEIRRLTRLADIAGRSFANATMFARSIAAGVTDELTGVHNRRYLDRRLADELKRVRRLGERLSLVLFDLDFFKAVNDEHGHQEGDRTLRAVAQTILAAVRDIDVVTRWGGEEFAVILPGTEGAAAIAVAERIRASVEAMRFQTAVGAPLAITLSGGIAWAAPHIHTPSQFVAAADRCLLEAKRTGRNRVVAAAPW